MVTENISVVAEQLQKSCEYLEFAVGIKSARLASKIACLLFCMNWKIEEIRSDQNNFEHLMEELYEQQLSNLLARLDLKKPTVAILLHDHAEFYNQQQIELLQALREDSRYNCVVLLAVSPYPTSIFNVDPIWFGDTTVFIPDLALIERLDFLNVVIAIDFCAAEPIKFPKATKRILQPHGLDIKFQYSVEFYGAGLLFDYVLAPSFSKDIFPEDYLTRYYNVFPKCLVDHDSKELRFIATGSLKLDAFIQEAEKVSKQDIIYNISYWGLESKFVHDNLSKTIKSILREFPDRRLVFRCYPGQIDLLEPYITEFRTQPNFYVSTADSYIRDYAAGAVLIYHRGSSAELFALATGSPIIHFNGGQNESNSVAEKKLGYEVYSQDQLIQILRGILSDSQEKRQEILDYRNTVIPCAGNSIGYLLNCIPDIIDDKPRPEWKRVLLYSHSDSKNLNVERILQSAQICKDNNFIIPLLASKAAEKVEDNPTLQFLAARAIFTHIYPNERVRDPWLIALKYLANYFRLRLGKEDFNDFDELIRVWLGTTFPERFMGLVAFAFKHFDSAEFVALRDYVSRLPLDTLDPHGVPQFIRDFWDSSRRNEDSLKSDLLHTKSQLGIELAVQGKIEQSLRQLRYALEMTPNNYELQSIISQLENHAHKPGNEI